MEERSDLEFIAPKASARAWVRFILYSGIGIFSFFISFPISEYSFNLMGWEVAVAANDTFLVNHAAKLVTAALLPVMHYVVYIFGLYGLVDLYIRRKKHFGTAVNTMFSIFKIIGMIVLTFIVFDFGPEVIRQESVGPFILDKILVSIVISIPMATIFLPFLLDYGLVDFFGVIMRPIMRPVFRLPGRAAVITVSAFLGNFSIGHIAVNEEYKHGRMTGREAAVIGTSLSTVSIGFLIVLANTTGIIDNWNIYFWTAFIITLLVTLIGVRIHPLSKLPETYYPEAEPDPEQVFNKNLFKNALNLALEIADKAEPFHKRLLFILKETMPIIGTVVSGTSFFGPLGLLASMYTPLFRIIGYIFYPFFWIIQVPAAELGVASTAAAVSLLEVTLPALMVTGAEFSIQLKYIIAILPVSSIIFFASFVPCLMSTEIPIKLKHILIIWVERMILSILIAGIFSIFLF